MKTIIVMLVIVFAAAASIIFFPDTRADRGPEPIRHGHDACARCRMHIAERGFAGELRDPSGAFSKYDDLGCLVAAMGTERRGASRTEVIPRRAEPESGGAWAEAYDTGRLIPLEAVAVVADSKIRTPMAYGLIAFEQESAARAFIEEHGGAITDRFRERQQ